MPLRLVYFAAEDHVCREGGHARRCGGVEETNGAVICSLTQMHYNGYCTVSARKLSEKSIHVFTMLALKRSI